MKREHAIRGVSGAVMEGSWTGIAYMDGDRVGSDRIHEVCLRLGREGETLHFDYTGSSPQVDAAVNCTLPATVAGSAVPLFSFLCQGDIDWNEGLRRCLKITAPEGTVVNAQPPAPVVGRNAITHTIVNALMMALSQAVPARITAAYYGMSNVHILSGDGSGDHESWIFFDIEVGGGGARQNKDGLDCYSQGIHNLANTPIEMIETTYPLRLKRYEFIPDTGGVGRPRGGLGGRARRQV